MSAWPRVAWRVSVARASTVLFSSSSRGERESAEALYLYKSIPELTKAPAAYLTGTSRKNGIEHHSTYNRMKSSYTLPSINGKFILGLVPYLTECSSASGYLHLTAYSVAEDLYQATDSLLSELLAPDFPDLESIGGSAITTYFITASNLSSYPAYSFVDVNFTSSASYISPFYAPT